MVIPYLLFNGQCEEAFRWYADIFGGKIEHISKYSDAPDAMFGHMDAAARGRVMHAHLAIAGGALSGGDATEDTPATTCNQLSIHVMIDNLSQAKKAFDALSEGGTPTYQLVPNPPPDDGSASGTVTDKYGFQWIITATSNG